MCAQLDVHGRYAGHLRIRHEGHRLRLLTHLRIFAVRRHTNNCVGAGVFIFASLQSDMVSQRIRRVEISFGKSLIDNHHLLSRRRIGFGEVSTHHEISPKNVQSFINLGSLYIQQADAHQADGRQVIGKYLDQALDTLEAAIKLNPRSSIAYYYLGSANLKSSFLEEAEAAFKKTQEIDPNMSLTNLMLANVYANMNKLGDAVRYLDTYLQENPKAENRAALEDFRAKLMKGLEASNQ